MITFNTFNTGLVRLGNKLFYYSNIVGLSEKFNIEFELPDCYLWKYLKNPPKIGDSIGELQFTSKDDSFDKEFIEDFFTKNKDKSINLVSSYQTELAFEHCISSVINSLEFKDEIINDIKNQYRNVFTKPTIGLGVRLGRDMTANSCFHKIPISWYIDSLNKHFNTWEKDFNVVVFSDNINEAKMIFKDYPFFYAESNDTHLFRIGDDNSEKGINHLILGSMMNNFIISQSTFSWWQAWLCKNNPNNESPKIIHCGENFAGHFLEIMKNKNYYPKNWILNKI
jgi:hypothetical protein